MSKSLLQHPSSISAAGKRRRVSLQPFELVLPVKAMMGGDLFQLARTTDSAEAPNRLINRGNSTAMEGLHVVDEGSASVGATRDLIHGDPPYDSTPDYRTKIILAGTTIEQRPTAARTFNGERN